ncbi:glycosyltransferase family 4 protein [Halobacillus litoralis]|uniref:Glycosyltransferase family 1 protein n=1 Tax=Halobacillus litoralis TaxID=45668 RepID=A0A410M6Q7_9BACI|nr:glycosyltransferase family 1 protein [Halobacillus litoralis]QAS50697.1 glycosyltransferase family 1 protein [Halobacillus litoralis]
MKVAIFTDTFVPQVNGVARTLKRLTDFFDKNQISYRVFAPSTKNILPQSASVHRLKSMPFWLYPEHRLAFPNLHRIKMEIERFQPDLLHIATPFNIGLTGVYYGQKMNIPLVGSYHTHFNQYLDYYKLPFLSSGMWKFMRWFHRPLQKIFVPSLSTKQELEQRGFSNISLWSRGVDHELFHPNVQAEWVKKKFNIQARHLLIYVGRFAPEKGLDVLMESAKSLPARISEKVHWLMVGNGPMYEKLRQNAPENMTFTGYLDGKMLTQMYASSSLFVFPSQTETFGNVVLEALACGTPAIVARAGGVQEIVTENHTGVFCEPGDPADFVQAISQLIEDPQRLCRMSKAARSYALLQTWDQVFTSLLNDYEEAIHSFHHPQGF